mgnify:CR=1 FL=1
MRDFVLIVLILFGATILKAATVSGFITRDGSGEPLQYVNVRVAETHAGMQTNKKGYYVINIPNPGSYTLELSLISYQPVSSSFMVTDPAEDVTLTSA